MRRTLYFLTRNTLAMVGLGILIFFIGVAVYGVLFDQQSSTLMQSYCGSYQGTGGSTTGPIVGCTTVCTYPVGTPPPQPNCYPTDKYDATLV